MALYTRESIDRLRDAIDFAELVSAHTDLRRAARSNYEGLCPFHDERTPSFGIDPDAKVYYCFGCEAKGDVFTFVAAVESIEFRAAVELLSDRYGVELELEHEDPHERERRARHARLLELLDRTAAFFERHLWESEEAGTVRAYLAARGLEEEALRRFRVGYAPRQWDSILNASRANGFTEQEILAAGLAQRQEGSGKVNDRFRRRIMFPLCDQRGRVIGFGARATRDEQQPKYVNSPESDLYHKRRHLFGANLARPHATRDGEVILCEGYTDVVAMHQAGLERTVGLMGTALTDEQVGELARMARKVVLALDADRAGSEAIVRAARAASARKLELRVAVLAPGSDPAQLLHDAGVEAVESVLAASVHLARFNVDRLLGEHPAASPEDADRTLEQLRPVFAPLPPGALRHDLLRRVADGLDLPLSVTEQALSETPHTQGDSAGVISATPASSATLTAAHAREQEIERSLLAMCLALPARGQPVLDALDLDAHFQNPVLRRAAERLRDGSLSAPLPAGAELDPEPEVAREISGLIVQAGGGLATAALLESQYRHLLLIALERQLRAATSRGDSSVAALARQRAEAKSLFEAAYAHALEDQQP
jgi:DNA primase